MDWTQYTTDPCDPETRLKIHAYLNKIRETAGKDDVKWILNQVSGKSCLDVGCIEHDLSYTERDAWKHKKIVEVSPHVVGVDILDEYIDIINQRGYDIRACDATSDKYLGEKFDTVFMGDVIEHVENPVSLIRFGIRHLNDDGKVIVKTPNPFYIDNIIKFAKNKNYVNFEHIAWFTPTMALEIARRAECKLSAYVVFPRKRPWSQLFSKTDIFTRDFAYIFSK